MGFGRELSGGACVFATGKGKRWDHILDGGPGAAIAEIRLPADWDELMAAAGYRPQREFYLE